MKAAIAKLWVKALRSGKYTQAKHALRRSVATATPGQSVEGFCCLGVLCNLHAQAHPEIAAKQKNARKYMGKAGALPVEVMKWAGIRDNTGRPTGGKLVVGTNSWSHLASVNDFSDVGFPGIATLIEKNVRRL
jgi:hypothetical protein